MERSTDVMASFQIRKNTSWKISISEHGVLLLKVVCGHFKNMNLKDSTVRIGETFILSSCAIKLS